MACSAKKAGQDKRARCAQWSLVEYVGKTIAAGRASDIEQVKAKPGEANDAGGNIDDLPYRRVLRQAG
ncbi:uncharacterized protein PY1_contig-12-51 [Novosphingobium sp. PY1]|nr:uncharacterized protein PY1_contig-12-51 [Novosphingobium sp. PY1]